MGYFVAVDMRSRRRPKQTVHPARSNKIKDANVSQKPGPVMVFAPALLSFFICCFTYAKSAMSMENAMRVMSAARKDANDESNVTVICEDKDSRRATKVTAVATGWTASPRVQELPMVTELLLLPVNMTE